MHATVVSLVFLLLGLSFVPLRANRLLQMQNRLEMTRELYAQQLAKLMTYIENGKCEHLYFDFGTNIGIQLRKLYEPKYFPNAPILPYFDKVFGCKTDNATRLRSTVCSIGFEPDHHHLDRLLKLQESYQNAGYPMVIFTGAAVWTTDGNITFYDDNHSESKHNRWGSSLINYHDNMGPEVVLSVNIGKLLHTIFHQWDRHHLHTLHSKYHHASKHVSANTNLHFHGNSHDINTQHGYYYDPEHSKVVAKLDIEGAEYHVLPHLISYNALCYFHEILAEWHYPNLFKDKNTAEGSMMFLNYWKKTQNICKLEFVDLDDESYGDGDDKRPLPLPISKGN